MSRCAFSQWDSSGNSSPSNSMWQHSCNTDIQGNVPQCSSGCSGLLLRLGAKAQCGWSCFSGLPEVNLLSVAQRSHKSYCENRQWHSGKPQTKAFLLVIASQKLEDYLPRAEGKGQTSSWVKPVIYYPVTSWSCSFILKSSQRILMVPRLWAKNTETEGLAFLPRIPSLPLATASKVTGSFPLLTLRLTSLVRGFHGKWLWEWAAEWYSCLKSKLAAPQQLTHRTII